MTEQQRRPGAWPVEEPADLAQCQPEPDRGTGSRARFEMVMASIRASLDEEPSEPSIRACARRWSDAITHAADEAAHTLRKRRRAG